MDETPAREIAEQPKPRVWSGLSAIIFAIVAYGVALGVSSVLIGLYAHSHSWPQAYINDWLANSTTAQFSYVLLNDALTILLLVAFVRLGRYKHVLKTLGLVRPKSQNFITMCGAAVVYYGLFITTMVFVQKFTGLDTDQAQEVGFNTIATQGDVLLAFLSLVVLPPLVEEILFRGFIFGGLRKSMKFATAALVTSALFAMPHLLESSGGLLWSAGIDTFILSLVLCYLREKTGNLWAGIGLHALKNGLAFYLLFIIR